MQDGTCLLAGLAFWGLVVFLEAPPVRVARHPPMRGKGGVLAGAGAGSWLARQRFPFQGSIGGCLHLFAICGARGDGVVVLMRGGTAGLQHVKRGANYLKKKGKSVDNTLNNVVGVFVNLTVNSTVNSNDLNLGWRVFKVL